MEIFGAGEGGEIENTSKLVGQVGRGIKVPYFKKSFEIH